MNPKTENLAIVMTDIVGYTETTAQQSRQENEKLLGAHNHILLPIVKRFKGRLVKSIGDGLLLVFRSPTDAMLCAMAMQDALFEYNRDVDEGQHIHIRVAASLGEVRVTKNDIFGEPVNTTSRIESITPKDEIYLSEAVYMAMNKAEVPSQEVGWKELKGISAPIRIFHIPRFSTPRLVPEDVMATEDISDLVYPYGGAHLVPAGAPDGREGWLSGRRVMVAGVVAALVLGTAVAAMVVGPRIAGDDAANPQDAAQTAATQDTEPAPAPKPEPVAAPARPTAEKPPVAAPKVATPKPARPAPPRPVAKAPPPAKARTASLPPLTYSSFREAKTAYRRGRLDRDAYKEAVNAIKLHIKEEMKPVRADLDAGRIDKREYKRIYAQVRKKYE